MHLGRFRVKARRLVVSVAFAVSLCVAVPSAFAGSPNEPWTIAPDDCSTSLLDAAIAGVDAALTVL